MIDQQGFRLNVGIILYNNQNKLFWGKRVGRRNAWQFPQGGIKENETLEQAMYRELKEELGLEPQDVEIISVTKRWLFYRLPKHLLRHASKPLCIGQKQKWFLLKFIGQDDAIRFDVTTKPEFDAWEWVDYPYPLTKVIAFKRDVYRQVLREFEKSVLGN